MRKKIFIVDNSYMGLDVYNKSLSCKVHNELEKYFDLKYLFFLQPKHHNQRLDNKNVDYVFLKRNSDSAYNKLINQVKIIFTTCKKLRRVHTDLVWIGITSSFINCFSFLFSFCYDKSKIAVQLFTPSVNKRKFIRDILDFTVGVNLKFYKHYIGKSEKLRKRYRLNPNKMYDVKIGMYDFGYYERDNNLLKLLFLGNLSNRNIHETVEGLALFIKQTNNIKITYDIIGTGSLKAENLIADAITNNQLEKMVTLHGYVSDVDIPFFLSKCNVGVSYVPMTEFYSGVPITKTIEYLLTGMPVIATKNSFNLKHIHKGNGVLCDDNPDSFAEALGKINYTINQYNTLAIREEVLPLSLKETVRNDYCCVLNSIINL